MSKEAPYELQEKITIIKGWLQRFGERDNETFSIQLSKWELSLQYEYDLTGVQIEPFCWCRSGFKHVSKNQIEDRTEEELDEIIDELLKIKTSN